MTLPSHASMLTGLYPYRHFLRANSGNTLAGSFSTLAEQLSHNGYDTAAFVSSFVLHSGSGMSQGFAHYDDLVQLERPATATAERAITWLRQERAQPFFAFVHFFDPHQPLQPPAAWAERFPDDLYAAEVAFADEALGRLLAAVPRDETLIIFAGDHGEDLGEHQEFGHGYFTYSSTLEVPFLLRYPDRHRQGIRDSRVTSLVDLYPTVLEYLQIAVPEGTDGISLQPSGASDRSSRTVYFECVTPLFFKWAPLSGLRTAQWHYIQAPRPELYDRDRDPGETRNVIDAHPQVAQGFARELSHTAPFSDISGQVSGTVSEEERQLLTALGYAVPGPQVAADLSFEQLPLSQLPDPKDRLAGYQAYRNAELLASTGRRQEAVRVLEELRRRYPEWDGVQLLIANILTDMDRREEADALLQALLRRNSTSCAALALLTGIYLAQQELDAASATCSQGLEVCQQDARLWDFMATIHRQRGDLEEAIRCGRRAVDLIGSSAYFLTNLGVLYLEAQQAAAAKPFLERALALQPDSAAALHHLGLAYLKTDCFPQAEACFRQLLEQEPDNSRALLQLNIALLMQSRISEAMAVSQQLIDRNELVDEARALLDLARKEQVAQRSPQPG